MFPAPGPDAGADATDADDSGAEADDPGATGRAAGIVVFVKRHQFAKLMTGDLVAFAIVGVGLPGLEGNRLHQIFQRNHIGLGRGLDRDAVDHGAPAEQAHDVIDHD